MPVPPREPNYDNIINEELRKIGIISLDKNFYNLKLLRKPRLNKKSSICKNPAYNDALVEAFITSVYSRVNIEYMQYLREIDCYEEALNKYKSQLMEKKSANDLLIQKMQIEFDTIEEFYNNFQNLAKSKFKFMVKIIGKGLNLNEESNDSEEKDK